MVRTDIIEGLRSITIMAEALSEKSCHDAHIAILEAELENTRFILESLTR